MEQLLICMSLSLIAGLLASRAAKAVRLPAVTSYLVAGLLLGPFFLGRLGLSGNCDVVEFRADPEGIPLQSTEGLWKPMPVEYKHGRAKASDADRLQLCAQAMALEEMLVCSIPEGALFYEETRRREVVPLTEELRQATQKMADEMHAYFARGYTPKSKPGTHCNACSLKELCLPVLYQRADPKAYLRAHLDEMQEAAP